MTDQLALPLDGGLTDHHRAALAACIEDSWQHKALCAGHEDDLWFPDDADKATARNACRVCRSCPVLKSCRAAGILGDEHGIWGATTRDQRRALAEQVAYGMPVAAVLDRERVTPAGRIEGVAA
jgi:hypothetical protein